MLVARWVTAAEQNLSLIAGGRTWDVNAAAAVSYLDRLVAAGYELSQAEQQLHADITAHIEAQTRRETTADDEEDDDAYDEDDDSDVDE
jgi:hypothetical protein